uniref:MATH domain-containing protein n=1 Tax=Caenorhabditis japonica TaxID=281687 RepID=A0A8R1EVB6_CAEJA
MDKEDEASYFLPKCRIVKTLKLSVRIDSLGETDRFGETVRVGKFDWCLTARRVYTKHLCKKSYLGVYLHCKSPLQPHEYANVSLHFVLNSFQYSSLHYWRNVWAQFDEHANTWGNDRFLSWDRLLNRSPFVKHGRICVEVDMKIKRENDLTKTPIRDDDGDMRLIFEDERKKWMIPYCKQRQNKKIAMEIEMANFTKTGVFTKEFKISGVPFSFRLLKNPTQNCLDLEFYCNWMDPSPWWRCEVFGEFKISNQKSKKYKKGEHFFAHSMFPRIFQKTDFCWNLFGFIDWDLLTNETYRCVKDGIFMLEVYVDLREKYGFDVADYDVNVGSVSLDFIEQFINDNATLQNVYTFAPIPLKVLNLNQDNGYSKLSELLSHLKSLNKNSINVMLIVNGSHVFLANKRQFTYSDTYLSTYAGYTWDPNQPDRKSNSGVWQNCVIIWLRLKATNNGNGNSDDASCQQSGAPMFSMRGGVCGKLPEVLVGA